MKKRVSEQEEEIRRLGGFSIRSGDEFFESEIDIDLGDFTSEEKISKRKKKR